MFGVPLVFDERLCRNSLIFCGSLISLVVNPVTRHNQGLDILYLYIYVFIHLCVCLLIYLFIKNPTLHVINNVVVTCSVAYMFISTFTSTYNLVILYTYNNYWDVIQVLTM